MKLIWLGFAEQMLDEIFAYYQSKANTKIALKVITEILSSTNKLRNHPKIGQKEIKLQSLHKEFRSLVSGNFKIVYWIENENIFISDVFDTRQDPLKINQENR